MTRRRGFLGRLAALPLVPAAGARGAGGIGPLRVPLGAVGLPETMAFEPAAILPLRRVGNGVLVVTSAHPALPPMSIPNGAVLERPVVRRADGKPIRAGGHDLGLGKGRPAPDEQVIGVFHAASPTAGVDEAGILPIVVDLPSTSA